MAKKKTKGFRDGRAVAIAAGVAGIAYGLWRLLQPPGPEPGEPDVEAKLTWDEGV